MLGKPKPCRHCESTKHQSYQCFYRPRKESKPCSFCGSTAHLSWQCYVNRKRIPQSKKKIGQGRISKQWQATRRQWYKENPPDDNGYYYCYICGKPMTPAQTTLDHKKSRSRHPELRFVMSNLAPCCWDCNGNKGSKNYDEMA